MSEIFTMLRQGVQSITVLGKDIRNIYFARAIFRNVHFVRELCHKYFLCHNKVSEN